LIVRCVHVFFLAAGFIFAPFAGSGYAADQTGGALSFPVLRFGPSASPPAECVPAIYGSVTSRAPDGALCLCHQSFDGKQSFWEQIGTGRPCWPDKK
jgi:hypothetical protein